MASIDKRPDGKWRARWREYTGGPQRSQHFARKVDAERHLVKMQHDLLTGAYVDPSTARVTLAFFAELWLERMRPTWRPNTAAMVQNSLTRHVLPTLGDRQLDSIRRGDLEALYAALPLAAGSVAMIAQHVGQLLGAAVEDGLLARNPASKAKLPRRPDSRAQPVPLEVLERIATALPDWMAVAVPLGAAVGLRQGEASGLSVDRVDFLRRTLRVDRQLVRGQLADPKTAHSNRTIPLAGFVVEALAEHLRRFPVAAGELVLLDPEGRPLDSNRFGHRWRRACATAGVAGLPFHHLRHTFASTLLSQGVSLKAVADWMGHASPTITLSTYAHLMPTDEGVARDVLEAAFAPAAEDLLRTSGGPL